MEKQRASSGGEKSKQLELWQADIIMSFSKTKLQRKACWDFVLGSVAVQFCCFD